MNKRVIKENINSQFREMVIEYNSMQVLIQHNGVKVINALPLDPLNHTIKSNNNRFGPLVNPIKKMNPTIVRQAHKQWRTKNNINIEFLQKLNSDPVVLKKIKQPNAPTPISNKPLQNGINTYSHKINITSKIKSPFSDTEFELVFRPSKYLRSEDQIWILISLLGEDVFKKALINNKSIVNSQFILNTLKASNQYFYISKRNKKLFSSINERVKIRYSDVSKVKITTLLKNIDLLKIEELIEKGEINYELTNNT